MPAKVPASRALPAAPCSKSRVVAGKRGAPGFADGGPGESRLRAPSAVLAAANGCDLYISDSGNGILRRLEISDGGMLTTVHGTPPCHHLRVDGETSATSGGGTVVAAGGSSGSGQRSPDDGSTPPWGWWGDGVFVDGNQVCPSFWARVYCTF